MEYSFDFDAYFADKNFRIGQLVTATKIEEQYYLCNVLTDEQKPYRVIDFYGLIKEIIFDDWFLVWYQDAGCEPISSIFHREELGMGFQPSYHPYHPKQALHDWLK